eukprot:m.162025 g.162025  ORF g.162025 m.162025 type:complete len:100 (+) comp38826_c0_seq12:282-581(+)
MTLSDGGWETLDSTSSLDRLNLSRHPAGGLPLGAVITSDEKEETIAKGFEMLKEVLPENAFHKRGPSLGPLLLMTDDSTTERAALKSVWRDCRQTRLRR